MTPAQQIINNLTMARSLVAQALKTYKCEYPTRRKANHFAKFARDIPCGAVSNVATRVRVFTKNERGETSETLLTAPLCLAHASLEAVKKLIEEFRVEEFRAVALKKVEEAILEKKITDQLISLNNRDAQIALVSAIAGGFGGVIGGTGELVDRRQFPNAVPLQANSKLDIPPPKSFLEI